VYIKKERKTKLDSFLRVAILCTEFPGSIQKIVRGFLETTNTPSTCDLTSLLGKTRPQSQIRST